MKISEKTQKMRFLPNSPTGQAENQNMYSPICLLTVPSLGQMANFWSIGVQGIKDFEVTIYIVQIIVPISWTTWLANARAAHEIKIFVIESFFPEEYLFYLFYAVQLSGPSRIGISIEDTAMVWPSAIILRLPLRSASSLDVFWIPFEGITLTKVSGKCQTIMIHNVHERQFKI